MSNTYFYLSLNLYVKIFNENIHEHMKEESYIEFPCTPHPAL